MLNAPRDNFVVVDGYFGIDLAIEEKRQISPWPPGDRFEVVHGHAVLFQQGLQEDRGRAAGKNADISAF